MRICIYTETALPKLGGQEAVIDTLARQYLQAGHDVTVLAPRPGRRYRLDDESFPYRVVRHPRFISTHRGVAWYRRWLLKVYRMHPFDVLHCQSVYPTAYIAACCKNTLPVPMVVTTHGGDVSPYRRVLQKPGIRERYLQALDRSDAVIAISRYTEQRLLHLSSNLPGLTRIPNGVDVEQFSRPAARPLSLDDAIQPGRYLLFIGRLVERKGVDLLLDAFSNAEQTGHLLVIAGEGRSRDALEAQARRLGISQSIRFAGRIAGEAKNYLLQNALCTVLPTREFEAFGLVVLESYACGTPVIGSDLPGLGDLIQPEKTGFRVPPESPGELARVLSWAFSHPKEMQQFGTTARDVAADYDWSRIAREHLSLFSSLITARRRQLSA